MRGGERAVLRAAARQPPGDRLGCGAGHRRGARYVDPYVAVQLREPEEGPGRRFPPGRQRLADVGELPVQADLLYVIGGVDLEHLAAASQIQPARHAAPCCIR